MAADEANRSAFIEIELISKIFDRSAEHDSHRAVRLSQNFGDFVGPQAVDIPQSQGVLLQFRQTLDSRRQAKFASLAGERLTGTEAMLATIISASPPLPSSPGRQPDFPIAGPLLTYEIPVRWASIIRRRARSQSQPNGSLPVKSTTARTRTASELTS